MELSVITDPRKKQQKFYSVSSLNKEIKQLFADHFSIIWVEGEISNLARPTSGHIYFTLKDAKAQVRCAMFRGQQKSLLFTPKNGDQVVVGAQVSLFETRGDYQLIIDSMEESGEGALRRAFEILKKHLSDEGLFDLAHKKTIPALPKQIGIITSPTGAAIHDILTVLERRFPAIPIIIYPTAVQGANAHFEIAKAIDAASERDECDSLLLSRGGGSLEDLWPFNEEVVARTIFQCDIPIITGIGHEIDFTIADFVADYRAPTPSAAAEAATPDKTEWISRIKVMETRLCQRILTYTNEYSQEISWLQRRLQQAHPGKRLQSHAQRIDDLELRLKQSITSRLQQLSALTSNQAAKLYQFNPHHQLKSFQNQLTYSSRRLNDIITRILEEQRQNLSQLTHTLDTVSPLATLSRGYAIVVAFSGNKEIIRSCKSVNISDTIETRLAEGRLICRVEDAFND